MREIMKKILLASTMLASVAGYAAADVAVSGSARMGVLSVYNTTTDETEMTFSSRVKASFSGSGTTDGGLAFGGSFDINEAGDASNGAAGSTFISGAFGKISMGSVDSGDKAAVGQIDGGVGYTGLNSGNSIGYVADGGFSFDDENITAKGDFPGTMGAGGAKVLYTYSAGAVTVSASTAQLALSKNDDHTAFGVGASYNAGALTVGLGYGSTDIDVVSFGEGTATDVSASIGYVMGDTTMKAIYQDKQVDVSYLSEDYSASAVSTGASVKHKIDAISLTAYAISTKMEADIFPGESVTLSRYGVGASFDLGGGASFAAGWAHNEALAENDDNVIVSKGVDLFDAGVNFSF
jgi:outer membrane protein OmpU